MIFFTSFLIFFSKVDFVWINRDQHSFEWFISLISAIELEQAEIPAASRFLDIHLYMTSALSPSDMKAIGLHVALDLIHKKKKRDTITGLMTRTQAGRPDWDEVGHVFHTILQICGLVPFCRPPFTLSR